MELIKDLFYTESLLFPRVYSVSKAISIVEFPIGNLVHLQSFRPPTDIMSLYVRIQSGKWHEPKSQSTRWRVLVASLELTWISPIYILHASKLNHILYNIYHIIHTIYYVESP